MKMKDRTTTEQTACSAALLTEKPEKHKTQAVTKKHTVTHKKNSHTQKNTVTHKKTHSDTQKNTQSHTKKHTVTHKKIRRTGK